MESSLIHILAAFPCYPLLYLWVKLCQKDHAKPNVHCITYDSAWKMEPTLLIHNDKMLHMYNEYVLPKVWNATYSSQYEYWPLSLGFCTFRISTLLSSYIDTHTDHYVSEISKIQKKSSYSCMNSGRFCVTEADSRMLLGLGDRESGRVDIKTPSMHMKL